MAPPASRQQQHARSAGEGKDAKGEDATAQLLTSPLKPLYVGEHGAAETDAEPPLTAEEVEALWPLLNRAEQPSSTTRTLSTRAKAAHLTTLLGPWLRRAMGHSVAFAWRTVLSKQLRPVRLKEFLAFFHLVRDKARLWSESKDPSYPYLTTMYPELISVLSAESLVGVYERATIAALPSDSTFSDPDLLWRAPGYWRQGAGSASSASASTTIAVAGSEASPAPTPTSAEASASASAAASQPLQQSGPPLAPAPLSKAPAPARLPRLTSMSSSAASSGADDDSDDAASFLLSQQPRRHTAAQVGAGSSGSSSFGAAASVASAAQGGAGDLAAAVGSLGSVGSTLLLAATAAAPVKQVKSKPKEAKRGPEPAFGGGFGGGSHYQPSAHPPAPFRPAGFAGVSAAGARPVSAMALSDPAAAARAAEKARLLAAAAAADEEALALEQEREEAEEAARAASEQVDAETAELRELARLVEAKEQRLQEMRAARQQQQRRAPAQQPSAPLASSPGDVPFGASWPSQPQQQQGQQQQHQPAQQHQQLPSQTRLSAAAPFFQPQGYQQQPYQQQQQQQQQQHQQQAPLPAYQAYQQQQWQPPATAQQPYPYYGQYGAGHVASASASAFYGQTSSSVFHGAAGHVSGASSSGFLGHSSASAAPPSPMPPLDPYRQIATNVDLRNGPTYRHFKAYQAAVRVSQVPVPLKQERIAAELVVSAVDQFGDLKSWLNKRRWRVLANKIAIEGFVDLANRQLLADGLLPPDTPADRLVTCSSAFEDLCRKIWGAYMADLEPGAAEPLGKILGVGSAPPSDLEDRFLTVASAKAKEKKALDSSLHYAESRESRSAGAGAAGGGGGGSRNRRPRNRSGTNHRRGTSSDPGSEDDSPPSAPAATAATAPQRTPQTPPAHQPAASFAAPAKKAGGGAAAAARR